jgi:hypothetical protein
MAKTQRRVPSTSYRDGALEAGRASLVSLASRKANGGFFSRLVGIPRHHADKTFHRTLPWTHLEVLPNFGVGGTLAAVLVCDRATSGKGINTPLSRFSLLLGAPSFDAAGEPAASVVVALAVLPLVLVAATPGKSQISWPPQVSPPVLESTSDGSVSWSRYLSEWWVQFRYPLYLHGAWMLRIGLRCTVHTSEVVRYHQFPMVKAQSGR